jgi:single-strand DNA-binding protein
MSINIAIIIGNLTKTPELKYTQSNKAYTKFTIAVNGYNDHVDYISVVAWDKLAENICKYQTKGSKLAVNGSITTGSYDDNNGVKHYTTDILARNVEFLTPKPIEPTPTPQQQEQRNVDNGQPLPF